MPKSTTPRRPSRRSAPPVAAVAEPPVNGAADPFDAAEAEPVRPKRRAQAVPAGGKPRRPRKATASAEAPEGEAGLPDAEDIPDVSLKQQLIQELEALIGRLRNLHPGYATAFSPERLTELLEEGAEFLPPVMRRGLMHKLRTFFGDDLLDADTWKGMWYVLNSSLQSQADVLKRRATGEYETDEWGLDREYMDAARPFADFMYKTYWRVQLSGMEHVPETGRGLLVANHSGQLPWDGAMLATGVMTEHPQQRLVRTLYATWFPTLPFISDFLTKCGQVLATEENGIRLLEQDELVAVFPEGYKGVGKLFKDRYKLARFGRGGFIKMAVRTGAPIIPVAVVGAEETYISLAKSPVMARLTGFPYFPISPTFPWLGLLGFIPLPTKWYIDFGEPIPTAHLGPEAANNLMLISQLTDQVRNVVQEMILARLAQRRSIFAG